ncbi:hypothetical protein BgiMline_006285 [Biomphalaria glabrata]|nr:hypothetical protein BgiMline_004248 [Biomphalaria glabrata]
MSACDQHNDYLCYQTVYCVSMWPAQRLPFLSNSVLCQHVASTTTTFPIKQCTMSACGQHNGYLSYQTVYYAGLWPAQRLPLLSNSVLCQHVTSTTTTFPTKQCTVSACDQHNDYLSYQTVYCVSM